MNNTNTKTKVKITAKEVLNYDISDIIELDAGSHNTVFSFKTIDNEKFVCRIFRDASWPENGKLEWINDHLIKHNIATSQNTHQQHQTVS